jgi:hypothetical protein
MNKNISKMMLSVFILTGSIFLSACVIEDPKEARPNNRVAVISDPEQKGKLVAVSKPCPAWEQEITDNLENQFRPQFGCSDSYNLGKMIVDPKDLLSGQEAGPGDASASVLGIERYREDKKKILINPKDISGTSSMQ